MADDEMSIRENDQQCNGNVNLHIPRIDELLGNVTNSTLTPQQLYGNTIEVQRWQEPTIYAPSKTSQAIFKVPNIV